MNPLYRQTAFLLSAPDPSRLPSDSGAEVAFAGRSNAGKSSAINAITDHKQLARISKTPGRTQQINVFSILSDRRLIDLPGYGYAKVPAAVRAHWQTALPRYLERRTSLRGLIVIMDVRHPLTEQDGQMLAWCAHARLPAHCLLTKADKLGRGAAIAAQRRVAATLAGDFPEVSVQLFSAVKGLGIDEVHAKLDSWLGLARANDFYKENPGGHGG